MVNRVARWGIVGLFVGVVGCGGGGSKGDRPAPTASIPGQTMDGGAGAVAAAPSPTAGQPAPFAEAVTENVPEEQQPPPDLTANGLSTGKVRVQVQKAWDQIAFTTAA